MIFYNYLWIWTNSCVVCSFGTNWKTFSFYTMWIYNKVWVTTKTLTIWCNFLNERNWDKSQNAMHRKLWIEEEYTCTYLINLYTKKYERDLDTYHVYFLYVVLFKRNWMCKIQEKILNSNFLVVLKMTKFWTELFIESIYFILYLSEFDLLHINHKKKLLQGIKIIDWYCNLTLLCINNMIKGYQLFHESQFFQRQHHRILKFGK